MREASLPAVASGRPGDEPPHAMIEREKADATTWPRIAPTCITGRTLDYGHFHDGWYELDSR